MAAKSKKRPSKLENKVIKLDILQLTDVLCPICQTILIEPVTLPCYHNFCRECFNGSVENNALCCPLCRTRIGSWLRHKNKQNGIVNIQLWDYLKNKFKEEVNKRLNGEEIEIPEEKTILRLSLPGEIRNEYENELKRLQEERLQLEQKHCAVTEQLIQKLQEEEEKAHKDYIERLKEDEELAKRIALENAILKTDANENHNKSNVPKTTKLRTIDSFLVRAKEKPETKKVSHSPKIKLKSPLQESLIDENINENHNVELRQEGSPEMVPSYGKFITNYLDRKLRHLTGTWSNKEIFKNDSQASCSKHEPSDIVKAAVRRLSAGTETESSDSVRQELCYFKPIESTNTSFSSSSTPWNLVKVCPVKGSVRVTPRILPQPHAPRELRNPDAPSAFVCLKSNNFKADEPDCDTSSLKQNKRRTAIIKPMISDNLKYKLRCRVRKSNSTGSLNISETPKKYEKITRKRKAASDSKKPKTPLSFVGTPAKRKKITVSKNLIVPFEDNNNTEKSKILADLVDLSPLKADPEILAQQLELERRIEQERKDAEFARALQKAESRRSVRGRKRSILSYH